MEQYIPKAALVAEIEKLYNGEIDTYTRNILDRLKSNINTIEAKGADLDAEIIKWEESFGHCPASMGYKETARHFFELGMRANNPITAADRGMAEEIIINLKRVEQDYRINLTNEMEWLRNQVKKGEQL